MLTTSSIPYNYVYIDLAAGESQSEWYASINPNGRMPAIVHVKEDGTSTTVFESGACLLYMASQFDKEHKLSYPIETTEYWTQLSWVSTSSCYYSRPHQSTDFVPPFLVESALMLSFIIALMADRRLRSYDRPSGSFLPLCSRSSSVRDLALYG